MRATLNYLMKAIDINLEAQEEECIILFAMKRKNDVQLVVFISSKAKYLLYRVFWLDFTKSKDIHKDVQDFDWTAYL